MTDQNNDEPVGYGKPPKHSRFRKGQSGNPKGRPTRTKNFRKDLQDVLSEGVPITQNGQPRNISTQKAALMRLKEKALKGDARALDRLLALAQQHSDDMEARGAEQALAAYESEILDRWFNRYTLDRAAAEDKGEDGDV
ncbi:DUF5681 domain-containing protein [Oceanicola sp. 502str15]|uniref:DUF5681 domain-containing protein n=1 Tax=Oceanicola sp. 502str15 TaxID=2696061 RepID=UPI002094BEC1|nr:DUF5681 domain-containing protein [Oceanicola sp. 502str15]MCO6384925.1 hypothetical protein [Oceanicola sp. 502str15]